jgi:hypothetical protein
LITFKVQYWLSGWKTLEDEQAFPIELMHVEAAKKVARLLVGTPNYPKHVADLRIVDSMGNYHFLIHRAIAEAA